MAMIRTFAAGLVVVTGVLAGCSASPGSAPDVESSQAPVPTPAQSGQWKVAGTGQPYLEPDEPYGQVQTTSKREGNSLGACRGSAVMTPPISKVVPQAVQQRFLLFSQADGPYRVSETGAPVEYAASPFGAALAAYNALSVMSKWDDYFHATGDEVLDFGEPMPEVLPRPTEERPAPNLPVAFQVHDCSDQTAVVDLLLDPEIEGTLATARFPMVYENGTWIWRTTPQEMAEMAKQVDRDLVDWGAWTLWQFG